MKSRCPYRPRLWTTLSLAVVFIVGHALSGSLSTEAQAGPWHWFRHHHDEGLPVDGVAQEWLWDRSPDLEQVVVASLFNRYCMRCHASDGRGTWNMPNLPDFTNPHWQATRTNAMIEARSFRGAGDACRRSAKSSHARKPRHWRYIRTFVPGTELSRPLIPEAKKSSAPQKR